MDATYLPTVLYCGLTVFAVLAASLAAFFFGRSVVLSDPIQPPKPRSDFPNLVRTFHLLGWNVSDPKTLENIEKIAAALGKAVDDERRETLKLIGDEYYERKNEFWSAYLQSILACSLIAVLAILLLTKTIQADAGLPIISAVSGFAVAKGSSGFRFNRPSAGRETRER